MTAPVCPKRFQELIVHDHKRIDPYYWLNNREDPEVINYLKEENQYFERQMKDTQPLQSKIYEEMIGRLDKKESSVPYYKDSHYYYQRYEEGKEYPIYARKKDLNSDEEEVLLDHNQLAEGKAYCTVGKVSISPNEKWIAFSEDQVSRRIYTLNLLDKISRKPLISIEGTAGGFCWSEQGDYLFYVRKDPQTLRPNQVFRHKIGSSPEEDQLMFEEKDEGFYTSVYQSKSKKYLVIHTSSFTTSEVLILPSDQPESQFEVFSKREEGVEYSIEHHKDEFYVLTNWKATNFRLMKTSIQECAKSRVYCTSRRRTASKHGGF